VSATVIDLATARRQRILRKRIPAATKRAWLDAIERQLTPKDKK